jgi:GT2 family glycosyltransferase
MPDFANLVPDQVPGEAPATGFPEKSPSKMEPDFDEEAYLRAYPDVAAAVRRGELKSGLEHYLLAGKTEGRLDLPQYYQQANPLARAAAGAAVSGGLSRPPAVSVEALIVSDSGAVFMIGWTDDRHNPLVAITLRMGQVARQSWTRFPRLRRKDVEQSLQTSGHYHHGFWVFAGQDDARSPRRSSRDTECVIELCYSSGAIAELRRHPAAVPDAELRDTAMGYFATCEYWGNRAVEAFASLDGDTGDAFIAFSRSISSGFAALAVADRFGQAQRKPKASIIVPLYGIGDYLFLQSCAYAQGRDIANYEFIYVVNSPELIEQLHREMRIVQMIYGLAQTLVTLPGNAGFGAANNVAVQFARSDRLLCINPDVFPYDPAWARRHLDLLAALPAAQTRLFGAALYYDDGSLMHGGMYFDVDTGFQTCATGTTRRTLIRVEHYGKGAPPWATQYVASRPVPAVTGAFMSVDRAWFETLGGFTEDYVFGHYEDADLCLKSLQLGAPSWIHDLRMWHLEGKGSRRMPHHEGGSLVNRWHFSRTWAPVVIPDLVGRAPQHPLLRTEGAAAAAAAPWPDAKPGTAQAPAKQARRARRRAR